MFTFTTVLLLKGPASDEAQGVMETAEAAELLLLDLFHTFRKVGFSRSETTKTSEEISRQLS